MVGGGLMGSLAARMAAETGREVVVLDCGASLAASPASGGLFDASWARGHGRGARSAYAGLTPLAERGEAILRGRFGASRLEFATPRGPVGCWFVRPATILWPTPVRARVLGVGDGTVRTDRGTFAGDVYVAAGAWTATLVTCPTLRGKAGAALLYPGEHAPTRWTWAPYRHAECYSRDPGETYFIDGTAVDAGRFGEAHVAATVRRAAPLGLGTPARVQQGVRPYCDAGPWFARLGRRTWAATGGGKFGTVVAAAFAERLVRELDG